jgi:hypothetical protein
MNVMRRRHALGLVLGLAAAFAFVPASASVSFTVVLDSLVRDSAAACVETPVEIKSVWEGGRIVTYTRVHVDRVLAGSLPGEVWVETLGGEVGDIGQRVEGEAVLRTGQQSVLFLSRYRGSFVVTARGQGQFPVVRDPAGALRLHKNHHAGALLAPRSTEVARIRSVTTYAPASSPAADVLDGKSIDDAATEISAAWRRTHATP